MKLQEGDLILDTESKRVLYGEREVFMTYKMYVLLKLFMENKGKYLSRARIMDSVWGGSESDDSTVAVHVSRLRKCLSFTGKEYIVNRSGFGYLFEEQNG